MIDGVMTAAELNAAIGAVNTRGRVRFKVPVLKALEQAHLTSFGQQDYADRIIRLFEECEKWLDRHHHGSKFRRRREGITKLRSQVAPLALPIIEARRASDGAIQDRRASFARTHRLSEQARTEQIGLGRSPGEVNDPRATKSRAGFHQDLLQATIHRARDHGHNDDALNPEQVGYLAAKVSLKIDAVLDERIKDKCRVEAMRVLCAMLGKNRQLATRFASSGIEVVVVPADRPMTDLVEFSTLKGVDISQGSAPSGRTWDETRGVGGLTVGGIVYVAVTEENLLGTNVTGPAQAAGGGCYSQQYSTTSHEFAHALHKQVLSAPQKAAITAAYNAATHEVKVESFGGTTYIRIPATEHRKGVPLTNFLDQVFAREFVDGPRRKSAMIATDYLVVRGSNPSWLTMPDNVTTYLYTSSYPLQDCYAAFDEDEFFAQAVNCYLGPNGGTDPYTQRGRHNGASWLRANETPQLIALLDELFAAGGSGYAQSVTPDTNVEEPAVLAVTVKDIISARKAERLVLEEFGAIDIS